MPFAQIPAALVLLGACALVFGGLARVFPCNPEHPAFVSKAIGADLVYCLFGGLYAALTPMLAAALAALPWRVEPPDLTLGFVARQPLWLQFALFLIVTDFAQYWLHRLFHGRRLWPFHAIHHGAPQVNWTTTFRVHPVNYLAVSLLLALLSRLLGVSAVAVLLAAPVFFFSGALTHANLDWTFGPLRTVIASPVFHRWHHADEAGCRDRNFAPMFPLWDVLFGTFHMPSGRRPAAFGVEGLPRGLAAQLAYPFRPKRDGFGANRSEP
jgi:sterol desaturase/sphingolipid hydroxylase (fatty acid hydroxylase superfamily)